MFISQKEYTKADSIQSAIDSRIEQIQVQIASYDKKPGLILIPICCCCSTDFVDGYYCELISTVCRHNYYFCESCRAKGCDLRSEKCLLENISRPIPAFEFLVISNSIFLRQKQAEKAREKAQKQENFLKLLLTAY